MSAFSSDFVASFSLLEPPTDGMFDSTGPASTEPTAVEPRCNVSALGSHDFERRLNMQTHKRGVCKKKSPWKLREPTAAGTTSCL